MGVKRVSSHTRRTPSGGTTRVDNYKQSFRDALRGERPSPVDRRRQENKKNQRRKRKALLSPKRGWGRLKRAFAAARRRRKLTAAVLAIGGVAEIGGFLAARGTGAVLMVTAMGLTALAGGLLAASRPDRSAPPPRDPPKGTNGRHRRGPETQEPSAPPPPPRARRGDGPTWVPSERVWATPPPASSTSSSSSSGGGGGGQRSRRMDGQPETDRDRKFFDLRESGYRGPIDQDGNRVNNENEWITETLRKRSENFFGARR